MSYQRAAGRVAGRILAAHMLGLFAFGLLGSINTSAGFDIVSGGLLVVFLGGIASLPLIVPVLLLASALAVQIEQHPLWFALVGPLVVSGVVALIVAPGAAKTVAASSSLSSGFYLLLLAVAKWRRRVGHGGESS